MLDAITRDACNRQRFVFLCFSATADRQTERREQASLCRQHVRARVPERRVQTGGRHQLVEGQRSTQGH
jgi:hypothetical protein